MRITTRCALGLLAPLCVAALHPPAAAAESAPAEVIHAGPACANTPATLVWSPPEGVADLQGYQITQQVTTPGLNRFVTTSVGPGQTSLGFDIPFGLSVFQIRAVTPAGVNDPYTSTSIMGNRAPTPMAWDTVGATVGDGRATVPFKWFGGITWSTTGGVLPTTLRVTPSNGASIESPAPHGPDAVITTFTGLANGADHTFSAVTSNACGSSPVSGSPTYVPGVGPAWSQAKAPLTMTRNSSYRYQFVAAGQPSPTYRLVNAPTWLTVGAGGLVTGTPPKGTTTFSYAVAASNGVGIQPGLLGTDIVTGTFTVNVTKR